MDKVNDFEVQFYKALRLLDFGKTEQASKILENVVAEALTLLSPQILDQLSCIFLFSLPCLV